jgi:coproporphyrinogen III oxidase
MHPLNPEVPIIHMNVRFFDFGNIRWFGGGIDLTPHYISGSDAAYFHGELKKVCDQFNADFYPSFKKNADDYFFIRHRDETRGIGGVFFDQLTGSEDFTLDNIFEFVKAIGGAFTPLYAELIERNNKKKFGANEVNWQRLRRGRYVEFNLVYDKGTRFGLETNGRTESILMSLPPLAAWDYDVKPQPGSREAQTLADLRKGIDWIK